MILEAIELNAHCTNKKIHFIESLAVFNKYKSSI